MQSLVIARAYKGPQKEFRDKDFAAEVAVGGLKMYDHATPAL